MAISKHQWMLGASLVLTVVAAVLAPEPDAATVVQPQRGVGTARKDLAASANAPELPDLHVLALLPRRGSKAATLFVTPPRPRPVFMPVPVMRPAMAVEPPLPVYNLIGRYDNGNGSQLLLLASGKDTVEAQVGDTVGNGWRIKNISDDGIVFVSPAGHEQLLPTGDNQ